MNRLLLLFCLLLAACGDLDTVDPESSAGASCSLGGAASDASSDADALDSSAAVDASGGVAGGSDASVLADSSVDADACTLDGGDKDAENIGDSALDAAPDASLDASEPVDAGYDAAPEAGSSGGAGGSGGTSGDAGSAGTGGAGGGPTAPRISANAVFVGHSLTSRRMTAMVSGFVAAAGYTLTKAEQNIPGTGLAANWNDSYWAPTQGQVDFKVALADGTRDVMVVVERVPVAGEAQAWGGDCWALAMRALAYQNNPDNEFYVFEAWNGVNNPLGVWPAPPLASRFWPEWRTSLTSNHARWVQIQTKSTDGTAAPWNAPAWTVKKPPLSGPYDSCTPAPVQPWSPSKLIPAATALARLYDSLPVGSIDVMSEVFADQIHMNDVGLYFVAAVVYSSIYEQSTMGLSPDMDAAVALVGGNYAGPDETTANALDVMAWNVVSGLWLFE